MKLKMATGGTANSNANLCKTCRFAQKRRAASSNDEAVRCSITRSYVVPMAECSDYEDASTPTLTAMREIAWHISADKKKGTAGFYNPRAYKQAIKDGQIEDDRHGPLILPGGGVDW